MQFQGKVAIVCGAGPGVGRVVALQLAKEGADLVVAARTASRLEEVAKEIKALGRQALAVPTDITRKADARNLADSAIKRFGRIDVLINLAFTGAARKAVHTYTEEELDEWHRAMDTGAWGTMLVCHYVAPYMVKARSGCIVNVTSMSSRSGYKERSDWSAGKAGVNELSHSLADELGPHAIRVNVVAPGHIWSDRLKGWYERTAQERGVSFEDVYKDWTSKMALRRAPNEEEVANAIFFMASDKASGITGATLDVNGGQLFK